MPGPARTSTGRARTPVGGHSTRSTHASRTRAHANGRDCAAHRAAQQKYVAKNPEAQRQRVQKHYKANAEAIKAHKKQTRRSSSGSRSSSGGGGGGKTGRPRTC